MTMNVYKNGENKANIADNLGDETHFCEYLKSEISEGLCTDIQMIFGGYIKASALPEIKIDGEAASFCEVCPYRMGG